MARLVYSLPCLIPVTDRNTNLSSFISCIELITVPSLPTDFEGISVCTNWVRESEDDSIEMRIRVISPAGKLMAEKKIKTVKFESYTRFRINVQLPLFEVSEEGFYDLRVDQKKARWKTVASLPLEVTSASEQPT